MTVAFAGAVEQHWENPAQAHRSQSMLNALMTIRKFASGFTSSWPRSPRGQQSATALHSSKVILRRQA
jgi:hypothetical protein